MNRCEIIQSAVNGGLRVLSEYDSKKVLARVGISTTNEFLVDCVDTAIQRANEIGFPVVMKGVGEEFAHKSELGLVRPGVVSQDDVASNFEQLKLAMQGKGRVLIQQMVMGKREFLAGALRDEQFGPVITFGLGGIFAEVFDDVSLRLAPLNAADAQEMINEIQSNALLGEIRGMEKVDTDSLANDLCALSRLCIENPDIAEIDINPLVVEGTKAIAVDALIVLGDEAPSK